MVVEVVEKDINGLEFIYENKDVLVFEPDPNQREPDEDERLEYGYYQFKNKTEAKRASKTAEAVFGDWHYEAEVYDVNKVRVMSDRSNSDITPIHKHLLKVYQPKVLDTGLF